MNVLAATGTSHANLMAVMPLAVAVPNATPAFINMIGLFLTAENIAEPLQETAGAGTAKSTTGENSAKEPSPAQIADAMIRSMLGKAPGGILGKVASPAAAPKIVAASTPNTVTVAASAGVANGNVAAGNPLGDKLNNTVAAGLNPPAQPARKQLRSSQDVPFVTITMANPMPLLPTAVEAPTVATPSAMAAPVPASRANVPQAQDFTRGSNAGAVSMTPHTTSLPQAKVAFAAVLTPIKDTAFTDTAKEVAASPEPAQSLTPEAPAPSSEMKQSPMMQGVESQVAVTDSGGKNAGGDHPSREQRDSPKPGPEPIAKTTPPIARQDDKREENVPRAIATPNATVHDAPYVPAPSFSAQATAPAAQLSPVVAAAAPFRATAEALRTSESNLPAVPQLRTGAVQEISIRIAQPDAPTVDLRVVERSGQVHIDVRTADAGLQNSLRQDLGTLTNSLQRAGYHAETFTPSSSLSRAASSSQAGNQDDRQDHSQNPGGSSDSSGRRQQQEQKRSGTWLEELDEQS